MQQRVLYGGLNILGPGWKSAIFLKSFPISGIAKLLQSISIRIVFWDYARYVQKTCQSIIDRDPKLVPHIAIPTQRWATSNKVSSVTCANFLLFQPRTYVPIIRQTIENLVFLFEIRSNFLKSNFVISVTLENYGNNL